jgi:hypothetical protein
MLMRRPEMYVALPVLAAALWCAGCSGQQMNTAATTTITTAAEDQSVPPPEQTTQTTTTGSSGHSTLLGATANFVWTVVSFPFRVVGDVIGEVV